MDFFVFDDVTNTLRLNESPILLIKEFKDLWDQERNKCKEDKSGKDRLLAFKEFTYIYLMLDFKSPYFKYLEQEKYEAALSDSGLTDEELKDPLFISAYNKYKEILDSDPILSLIRVAHKTLYRTQVFLDSIDFTEIDEMGKPIYKPKDVIADIAAIGKMRVSLLDLEEQYKNELSSDSNVRGGIELGFDEA